MMLTTNRTQSNFTLTCRRFLACATAADVLDSKNDQNDDGKKAKGGICHSFCGLAKPIISEETTQRIIIHRENVFDAVADL